jgi:hypothetical protein
MNKHVFVFSAAFALALGGSFLSCAPATQTSLAASAVAVSISIEGTASSASASAGTLGSTVVNRGTLYPAGIDGGITRVEFEFLDGGASVKTVSIDTASAGPHTVELEPGAAWVVKASVYNGDGLFAYGESLPFALAENETQTVPITAGPAPNAGDGTFSYTVTADAVLAITRKR